MLQEKKLEWESTDKLTAVLQEVEIVQRERGQMTTGSSTRHQEMEADMLAEVPEQLWSKHNTVVGFVHSKTGTRKTDCSAAVAEPVFHETKG